MADSAETIQTAPDDGRIIVAYQTRDGVKYARRTTDQALADVRERKNARILTAKQSSQVQAAETAAAPKPTDWERGAEVAATEAGASLLSGATALPRLALAGASALAPEDTSRKIDLLSQQLEGHQMLSSAYGAASELTGGDRTAEAEAQSAAQTMRQGAEQYPGFAMGGKIGGAVAGAALTGVGGLAHGAGKAAAAELGGGVLAQAGGLATAGGIEGAQIGVMTAGDEAFQKNVVTPGSELIGSTIVSAVAGGAIGGGLSLAGSALTAAGKGVLSSAGKVFGRSAKAAEPAAATASTEAELGGAGVFQSANRATASTEHATGVTAEFEQTAMPAAEREAARAERAAMRHAAQNAADDDLNVAIRAETKSEPLEGAADAVRQGLRGKDMGKIADVAHGTAAREIAADLNESNAAFRTVEDKVVAGSGLKPDIVRARLAAEGFSAEAPLMQRQVTTQMADELDTAVASYKGNGANVLKTLARNARTIEGRMVDAAPEDVFCLADQLRGMQTAAARKIQKAAASTGDLDMAAVGDMLEAQYTRARSTLADAGWGAVGQAQLRANTAQAAMIRAEKDGLPLFAREVEGPWKGQSYVRSEWQADEGKIVGHIANFGRAQGAVAQRALDDINSTRAAYAEAVQSWGLSEADTAAMKHATASVDRLSETLATARTKVGAIEQAKETLAAQGRAGPVDWLPRGIGRMLGGISDSTRRTLARVKLAEIIRQDVELNQQAVGGFVGIARSGATAVGGVAQQGAGLAKHHIMHTAVEWAQGTIGQAGAAIASPVAGAVAVPGALVAFTGREKTPAEAYKKKAEQIRAVTSDGGASIREAVTKHAGQYADAAPTAILGATETASRGLLYLRDNLPTAATDPTSLTPISSAHMPSRGQVEKFARIYQTVTEPNSVLRDLSNGSLTTDQVAALRVVHPEKYQRIVTTVMDALREADQQGIAIPVRKRLTIAVLFGAANEPALTPEFAAKYGPRMGDASPGTAPQGPAPAKPGPTKLGDRLKTGTSEMLGGLT